MEKINSVDCYAEFKKKSSVVADYCQKIIEDENVVWSPHLGWDATLVPKEIFLEESAFKIINENFPINRAGVLRTDPYQNYHWHVDQFRGVSINLLITPEIHSYCLFGKEKNADNMYFTELKYTSNTFYLFNTQFHHSVINFDRPRYLFSLEFFQSKENLTYSTIYNWCKEKELLK